MPAVPYSLPTWRATAAALELEAAVEPVELAELSVADAPEEAADEEAEPLEPPLEESSAEALREPQMKDWQKV